MHIVKGYEVTKQKQTEGFAILVKSLKSCWLAWAALVMTMSGCTMLGPDFVKPDPPLLDHWQKTQTIGFSEGQIEYRKWWQAFNDPVLDKLIEMAHQQNLSLQIAGIRIYEARAYLGIAVGSLYPQEQSVSGELENNKLSKSSDIEAIDDHFNSMSVGFDAAWELDVWGKYRRSVQSGAANLAATVANYDNVLVSLTAEVARTYIMLRTMTKQLVIADNNISLQENSLHIAEVRFKEGAVSELDVAQARMLLSNTKALIPRLESGVRQAQNGLATLLGLLPGELHGILDGPAEIPVVTEAVIIDIPSNLLRRRPDIRLSESNLAAQSPQVGIAKAGLYPRFYLFGTLGWRSSDATTRYGENSLGDLFDNKSMFWNGGPGFSWDILNYGRITNSVRAEDARLQQLVVDYKRTVLNAQREVEDAMAAFAFSKEEERFLKDSVAAAKRSVDISMIQYREGTVDYQRVLDSQRFLTTQADNLAAVSGQVGTNLVATYKALGGGWQMRKGEPILSDENKNEMTERTSWGHLLDPEKLEMSIEEEHQDWRRPDW